MKRRKRKRTTYFKKTNAKIAIKMNRELMKFKLQIAEIKSAKMKRRPKLSLSESKLSREIKVRRKSLMKSSASIIKLLKLPIANQTRQIVKMNNLKKTT